MTPFLLFAVSRLCGAKFSQYQQRETDSLLRKHWVSRDRGVGGTGGARAPQYFYNYKELVRKCLVPPNIEALTPPSNLKVAPRFLVKEMLSQHE